MTSPKDLPCWAAALWALQLVPAVTLVVMATSSLGASHRAGWIALVAGAWIALVLLAFALPSGRRWLARWRREWLLAGASMVVALCVLDVVVGMAGLSPSIATAQQRSPTYSFHRHSGYRLLPSRIAVDGGEIVVNARGFRGSEIDVPKPEGRLRVAFLGGSQVFDFDGVDWPRRSGELLRASGLDVDVINAGVPGHTSVDALSKLTTDVWTLRPDFVVVCHGWNDLKYFPRISAERPYREPPPAAPVTLAPDWRLHPRGLDALLVGSSIYRLLRPHLLASSVSEEGRMVARHRDAPSDAALGPMGPEQLRLNLTLLVRAARALGAGIGVCQQAFLRDGNTGRGASVVEYIERNTGLTARRFGEAATRLEALVAALAERERVAVLDMRSLARDPANFVDAVHFGVAGSEAAAQLVAEWLRQRLVPRSADARPRERVPG